jgi:hypothetical protein
MKTAFCCSLNFPGNYSQLNTYSLILFLLSLLFKSRFFPVLLRVHFISQSRDEPELLLTMKRLSFHRGQQAIQTIILSKETDFQ